MYKSRDLNGRFIQYHDVVRLVATRELALVVKKQRVDTPDKSIDLFVENKFIGLGDWLDVYPDGELEVLGNADLSVS